MNKAKYMIEIVPAIGPGIELLNDVKMVLSGGSERETEPFSVASKNIGTEKRKWVEATDVGDVVSVTLTLGTSKPWNCIRITVWKDFRYWVFDCADSFTSENRSNTLRLSGNKQYQAFLQTGNDENAGTHGGILITLIGDGGEAGPKLLKQGVNTGTQSNVRFRAADVGNLEKIIISNNAKDDPWYCDLVRIQTEEGASYPFTVKRWIGSPYEVSILVDLVPSKFYETPPQDIECHTRASDIVEIFPEEIHTQKAYCPMNCQASQFSKIEGSTLHPATSSICSSAILDGVLSPSGGEIVISVVPSVPEYSGSKGPFGLEASSFVPSVRRRTFSYYMYRTDSIDDVEKNIRVVDGYGKFSSTGRLEIRRNGLWGSVCAKGDSTKFTSESAAKACQELGYLHGIFLESCAFVNGHNVCGRQGYPVAVAGVMCTGSENSFADCKLEEPADFCQDHANDVAVQCTNHPPDREPEPGTLRIADVAGGPAVNGEGRLEVFLNTWGTVCRDGWTPESERVACIQMGYSGMRNGGISDKECSDVNGINYCGRFNEKIHLVNVTCDGEEGNLRSCHHETNNDIYCVHEEDIVIACKGSGDPSGIGLFIFEELPDVSERKFPPKASLQCGDKPISKKELKGNPGSSFLVECPQGCSDEAGTVKGSYIYTDDSSICRAAIHSGVLQDNGGEMVLTLGHRQESFHGSEQFGIMSESSGPYDRSFTVSYLMQSVKSRAATEEKDKKQTSYAGVSSLPSEMNISSFRQIEKSTLKSLSAPPKFSWYSSDMWKGFNGHQGDYVDARMVPGGDPTTGFRDFSFCARAKTTGGEGTWRTVFSHSDCGGIQLAVNNKDELVLEQTCTTTILESGFKPKLNEWFHVVVTYFQPELTLALFVNGELATFKNVDQQVDLKTHLTIGRSSEIETDYFIGEITAVRAFDYVLSPDDVNIVLKEAMNPPQISDSAVTFKERRTVDGRQCVSPCSAEKPLSVVEKEFDFESNFPIQLSCEDTLEKPEFNGKNEQKFRIECPDKCGLGLGKVYGTFFYADRSPICKALLHSGIGSREAILVSKTGISHYKGSRGHGGILSIDDLTPHIRSFSFIKAPVIQRLSCEDDASFVLKMAVGETQLLSCPQDCSLAENAPVYGYEVYSARSSVCRAAIHAGVIGDVGGQVRIRVEREREKFEAKSLHGVQSQEADRYIRSFVFSREK